LYGTGILLILSRLFLNPGFSERQIFGLGLVLPALAIASKIYRFYNYANDAIELLWLLSVALILLSTFMEIFDWGASSGLGSLGIIAFIYTWQYSFLENMNDKKQ